MIGWACNELSGKEKMHSQNYLFPAVGKVQNIAPSKVNALDTKQKEQKGKMRCAFTFQPS